MAEIHEVTEEHAERFWQWLRERGGIAIWHTTNLSNPTQSWSAPARSADGEPLPRPHRYAEGAPRRIITDPAEVAVITAREVKRFGVDLRMGSQGTMLKLTDDSVRQLREERAAAEEQYGDAWYAFDYETQEAVIYTTGSSMPLVAWAAAHKLPKFPASVGGAVA